MIGKHLCVYIYVAAWVRKRGRVGRVESRERKEGYKANKLFASRMAVSEYIVISLHESRIIKN